MDSAPVLSLRDRIDRLEAVSRALEQVDIDVSHHFARGMYARSAEIPAGALIVGVEHKFSHFVVLMSGEIEVADAELSRYVGPFMWRAEAGSKRAVRALSDCWIVTFHACEADTPEGAERELAVNPEDLQTARLRVGKS